LILFISPYTSELILKHSVDFLDCLANEEISALVTCKAASYECAVVAALFCFFGRKISPYTAGELNKEGLRSLASRSYLVAIVKEKLKWVGSKCNVAKLKYVRFNGEDIQRVYTCGR
jgi:hypothetical protein